MNHSSSVTLTASGIPPPALCVASLGACTPWLAALSPSAVESLLLLLWYLGYVKVRRSDASAEDVWKKDGQGTVARISRAHITTPARRIPQQQQPTHARLRATLLSAHVRNMRRTQAAHEIRLPRASFTSPVSPVDESDSASDLSDSDLDYASSVFSSSTACSSIYSELSLKTAAGPLPTVHAPRTRAPPISIISIFPSAAANPAPTKTTTTTYLYKGGVTRVMTGGVMLGPHPRADPVPRSTWSCD